MTSRSRPGPATGFPSASTVPPSAFSRPAIMLSKVVLPQPLAPTRHTNSPSATFRLTRSSARTLPEALRKLFDTPSTESFEGGMIWSSSVAEEWWRPARSIKESRLASMCLSSLLENLRPCRPAPISRSNRAILHCPTGLNPASLKKSELVRVRCWDYRHIAAGLRDFKAVCFQPRPTGNVLCVAKLWRCNFFPAKVRWRLDGRIRLYYQSGASIGCAGDYTNFFAVRFEVRVERGTRAHVRDIERSGKDRFHCRRPGIVGEPLNLDIGSEPLFKPAFTLPRECVRDYALRMSDVWKMPESNRGLLLGSRKRRPKQEYSNNCCYFYFHNWFQQQSALTN